MEITKDMLNVWGACKDGRKWFDRRFPAGKAEYQDVLNALVHDNRYVDAEWLLDHAGPDPNAAIEVESIKQRDFLASGKLVIKDSAIVFGRLRAGSSIEAGGHIEAGGGI